MTVDNDTNPSYLDTLEGEIAFFRSVMRARPVGIHRHFHVLVIRNTIHRETGRWIETSDIWRKLRDCYDLDNLESIEADGFDIPGNKGSSALPVRSPSPSGNLHTHPYFRNEYNLPNDPSIHAIVSRRRMRSSTSSPSTSSVPSPSRQERPVTTRGRRRNKSKLNNMAGLIAGDSDSSALTQESGDESISPTPATGTDAATEDAEDGDYEHDQSPEFALASKHRKSSKTGRRNSIAGRTKTSNSIGRSSKKRKR